MAISPRHPSLADFPSTRSLYIAPQGTALRLAIVGAACLPSIFQRIVRGIVRFDELEDRLVRLERVADDVAALEGDHSSGPAVDRYRDDECRGVPPGLESGRRRGRLRL